MVDLSLFKPAEFNANSTDFDPRDFDNLGSRGPSISDLDIQDLGNLSLLWGEYHAAIRHYERLLRSRYYSEELSTIDRVRALNNLGLAVSYSGQFERAMTLYQEALELANTINEDKETANILGNIGVNFYFTGNYNQAIFHHLQALDIHQNLNNTLGIGNSLNNLAAAYSALGRHDTALEVLKESLIAFEDVNYAYGQSSAFSNVGTAYFALGRYAEAIQAYQAGLSISRPSGSQQIQANLLNNLGVALQQNGQYSKGSQAFQESLGLLQKIGDRRGVGINLGNIGRKHEQQGQSELAIVFYKKSVNIHEAVRQEITNRSVLKSYTNTVSETYRRLANLLLEQGRILEAQKVLELLKFQEIREFTQDERTGGYLAEIILLPKEQAIIFEYTTLVAFGQRIRDCEASDCDNLSALYDQRDEQFWQYQKAVTSLVSFIKERLDEDDDPNLILDPTLFETTAKEIIDQQPGTVVVYPLVLEKKLWLLWTADGRIISRREILVDRLTLGNTVVDFRNLIEDRYSDPLQIKALGQQLYNWLIAPIADELTANQDIQNLVFSLDRTTRYLPMGALHNGDQYLIEKYTVTTILSAALTDVDDRSPVGTEGVSILGAGMSQQFENFPALPNVPIELDAIIREQNNPEDTQGLYSGQQILDPEFTYTTLRNSLRGKQLLHIATHGEFIPGRRDESYLLMGDGEKLPIPDIEKLKSYMEDVHLVVLSACQTALGGPNEEGLEIAGLAFYFLKSQVDAVMASLWNVQDSSTSQLMQIFYQQLASGTETKPVTKAEALRFAQLALLNSNTPNSSDTERFTLKPQTSEDQPRPKNGLAHPYYWAPFILIGNGL